MANTVTYTIKGTDRVLQMLDTTKKQTQMKNAVKYYGDYMKREVMSRTPVDTWFLHDSYYGLWDGAYNYKLTNGAKNTEGVYYDKFVEYGTRKMNGYHMYRDGAAVVRPKFRDKIKKIVGGR